MIEETIAPVRMCARLAGASRMSGEVVEMWRVAPPVLLGDHAGGVA